MSNVFVIRSAATIAEGEKNPRLAWDNNSDEMFVTADQNTPDLPLLWDNLTTKRWLPGTTTSYIEYSGGIRTTDYIAIAGANWATSVCAIVIKVNTVIVASMSGLRDNQPIFLSVPLDWNNYRIEFTCQTTALEIGEIMIGVSIKLPKNVSVGYSPGRWNNEDLISNSRTQANQFGPSTIEARGTEESFSLDNVLTSYIESDFTAFQNSARGRPVFFVWNKDNYTQATYGHWELSKLSFVSSLFSSIRMTIKGVS